MKFCVLLICLSFGVYATPEDNGPLDCIEFYRWLRFEHRTDECGEWGGNKETIVFYKEKNNAQVFADYVKIKMDCNNPNPYSPTAFSKSTEKKRILVSTEQQQFANDCIVQLMQAKLTTPDVGSHTGINNVVMLQDSSFIINDYPSISWSKFEFLRDKLLSTN